MLPVESTSRQLPVDWVPSDMLTEILQAPRWGWCV